MDRFNAGEGVLKMRDGFRYFGCDFRRIRDRQRGSEERDLLKEETVGVYDCTESPNNSSPMRWL
jgi:hypothetical protein